MPIALFVAARNAPQLPNVHPPLAHLPAQQLLDGIRYYYQPSEDAWDIPELADLLIPILRADVGLCDKYVHIEEPPLSCPIYAFVGENDRGAPVSTVEAWKQQTTGRFSLQIFSGGHFFINDALGNLQKFVRTGILENLVSRSVDFPE